MPTQHQRHREQQRLESENRRMAEADRVYRMQHDGAEAADVRILQRVVVALQALAMQWLPGGIRSSPPA